MPSTQYGQLAELAFLILSDSTESSQAPFYGKVNFSFSSALDVYFNWILQGTERGGGCRGLTGENER